MSVIQQIFLFFYAILYGALFTISDRYKPFTGELGRQGLVRFFFSIAFLGFLPIAYFSYCFLALGIHEEQLSLDFRSFFYLILVFFLVSPIYGFYCLWAGVVLFKRSWFYSDKAWKILSEQGAIRILGKKQLKIALILGGFFTLGPLLLLLLFF